MEDEGPYGVTKHWALKMPNLFVATFDIQGVSSFNFRNIEGGDATVGYTIEFNDTLLTLKYNDVQLGDQMTIPSNGGGYRKVYLTFEKKYITVTVDGTTILTFDDILRSTAVGEYVNFFTGTGSSNFKNLKIVSGHLISDGTNNVLIQGDFTISGNMSANKLTVGSINTISSYNLEHVTGKGSTTSDTIYLTNPTTGLVVDSNISARKITFGTVNVVSAYNLEGSVVGK